MEHYSFNYVPLLIDEAIRTADSTRKQNGKTVTEIDDSY